MIFREENYTCKSIVKEHFLSLRRIEKSEAKVIGQIITLVL